MFLYIYTKFTSLAKGFGEVYNLIEKIKLILEIQGKFMNLYNIPKQ